MDGASLTWGNTCNVPLTGSPGVLFTQLINTLMAAQCALARPEDYPLDYGDRLLNGEEFDFIVVGAGKISENFGFYSYKAEILDKTFDL